MKPAPAALSHDERHARIAAAAWRRYVARGMEHGHHEADWFEAIKEVDGTTEITDDLVIIEGIGPKIAEVYAAAGIRTFAALAATSVEQQRAILAAAGPRFKLADPTSWSEQAALAHAGQWEALKALQQRLDGGVAR